MMHTIPSPSRGVGTGNKIVLRVGIIIGSCRCSTRGGNELLVGQHKNTVNVAVADDVIIVQASSLTTGAVNSTLLPEKYGRQGQELLAMTLAGFCLGYLHGR